MTVRYHTWPASWTFSSHPARHKWMNLVSSFSLAHRHQAVPVTPQRRVDRVKIVNVSPPYCEKAGNRALHSMANTVDGCPLSPSVPYKPSCVRVCSRVCARMCTQLCPTLCDPMDCSLRGSSVHGILQARILQWVAISSSGGSF